MKIEEGLQNQLKTYPEEKLFYIYDLPKSVITNILLSKIIKDITGFELESLPQIIRNPDKPFYSAMICIPNNRFEEISKKLRHFEINLLRFKYSLRGLPYDKDLTFA